VRTTTNTIRTAFSSGHNLLTTMAVFLRIYRQLPPCRQQYRKTPGNCRRFRNYVPGYRRNFLYSAQNQPQRCAIVITLEKLLNDTLARPGKETPDVNDTSTDDTDLIELTRDEWLDMLRATGDKQGYFKTLGRAHSAILSNDGTSLLVSFENADTILDKSEDGLPMGMSLAESHGWSQLTLLSHDHSWFRDQAVYDYFDRLVDDGFFDDFDDVVFFGAGSCGYAAAAYSVTAPGASVLALAPQATLAPEHAGWDKRFAEQRRQDFTSRYGYAPDMCDAAKDVFLIYDPHVEMDAMHAALFNGANVTRLRARHLGPSPDFALESFGILDNLIEALMDGQLTQSLFSRLFRARHQNRNWLVQFLNHLQGKKQPYRVARMCRHVLHSKNGPRFRKALSVALQTLEEQGIAPPPAPQNADTDAAG
jgi:hypothetical protein